MTKSAKQFKSQNKRSACVLKTVKMKKDENNIQNLKKQLLDFEARICELENKVNELEACLIQQRNELIQCPICHNNEKSFVLQCGHCFSENCITKILKYE